MNRLAEEWAIFLLAVQFLTRLPVRTEWSDARMAATPRWYPLVGALVGGFAALVYWVAALALPPVLAVLLSVAAGVIVTGALHEDGFADCCDGLGGSASRERALEIMRDSRLGTYGALGLGLLLAIKVASLVALPVWAVPAALIAGHAASRASAVLVMATSTYVRVEGAGSPVAAGPPGLGVTFGAAGLACLPLLVLAPVPALAALLGMAIAHIAMRRVFERRLGGYTGDCLGAVQQTGETAFYVVLVGALSAGI